MVFATLTSLNVHTITRLGTDVSTSRATLQYETRNNQLHMLKLGLHRRIIYRFLNYVSEHFALESSSGRDSTNNKPRMILSSDMNLIEVYKRYVDCFTEISTSVSDGNGMVPANPMTFSVFTKYQKKERTTLKVAKNASNTCALCTKFQNYIAAQTSNDERHFF